MSAKTVEENQPRKLWLVTFDWNGGEYTSDVKIRAVQATQIKEDWVTADGIDIQIPGPIISIDCEG